MVLLGLDPAQYAAFARWAADGLRTSTARSFVLITPRG
jgi:hypothetical protein